MVNAKDFIDKVKIPLNNGWGYIYGTWGELWTKEAQAKLNKTTDTNRAKSRQYGSKWIGKMVTDCSGLVRWAMAQLGEKVAHHATYLYTDYCRNKGKLVWGVPSDGHELLPGSLVFIQGSREKIHHVGVYVGDDICIEAKGAQFGVVTSDVSHWDHWGELKAVDYSNSTVTEVKEMATAVVVNTTSGSLNMRKGPGKAYGMTCKIPQGAMVEVVDTSNEKWYQIKYGGRLGWASTDYLQMTVVPEVPFSEPETPATADTVPSGIGLIDIFTLIRSSLNALNEEIDRLEAMIDLLK